MLSTWKRGWSAAITGLRCSSVARYGAPTAPSTHWPANGAGRGSTIRRVSPSIACQRAERSRNSAAESRGDRLACSSIDVGLQP